ncbi:hypothetical protein BH23ACT5_BH23ACT5_14060 [soil metagenome]
MTVAARARLTLPTVGAMRDGASVELRDQPAADRLLDAFRSGRPMDNSEGADSVHLQVLNEPGLLGVATAGQNDMNTRQRWRCSSARRKPMRQGDTSMSRDMGERGIRRRRTHGRLRELALIGEESST